MHLTRNQAYLHGYRGFKSLSLRQWFIINNLPASDSINDANFATIRAMANTTVSVTKRVKTDQGMRYLPVVLGADGRPRKDGVWQTNVDEDNPDKPVAMRHPEGAYYLDWYSGSKRIRLSVGKDHDRAWDAKLKKEAELKAQAVGIKLVETGDKGQTLKAAADGYLDEVMATKKPGTFSAYKLALTYFQETCVKEYVSEIDRADMMAFKVALRDTMELSPRTVWNHFSNIVSFLKASGKEKIVKKGDWPVYTEEEPETYEPEELTEFFAACAPDEKLLFQFFLMSGFREQETMYITWRDVNQKASTVSVKHKPQYHWTPKAYKERSVPVPTPFLAELVASKPAKAKPADLVFPTASGKPDTHILRSLKRLVQRAELNCGLCDSCVARNECERWWLHKFRATFATTCLQNGLDLKTVQSWLGHSDLQSTMRYLKAARGAAVQAKVESIWNYA
jgi:integrase/recombinase XerD